MNEIRKSPVETLGYQFIEARYLPKGRDEYYLRDLQRSRIKDISSRSKDTGVRYRQLSAYEIEVLVRNRNTSANWNDLLVTDAFTPELVQNCKFFGLVRIGKLEPWYLEFHNLRRPVGLYNSTIISCDLGDNLVVDNVNYLSHYIIGNDVMVVNVNELATTDNAKFGNGILKQGEPETRRIHLEICNENGGRSVIPFDGMLAGDAWLWSRFREDSILQDKFRQFTEKQFDNRRGYYGIIGDRSVIKNCKIIKDTLIGSDAYLKGANKLKNLTINSSPEAKSQIGEGCELVNGIIGFGCRIFYGVKAVRFVLASHSQLKYGARLINSYLGENSTISCCEVLNSLIFPSHEQHHNNSFLCASLVMGQSNMAAGATVGSNHNSRSPDGEIIAGRGFWPGLCVSLKHNSRFACFTILAKGDYPAELDIPIPFSLVSNDVHNNELVIMPAYWFLYNMYALSRNAWKYRDRDKRTDKTQLLETDFLAPDSIDEMIAALTLFERFTGKAWLQTQPAADNAAAAAKQKLSAATYKYPAGKREPSAGKGEPSAGKREPSHGKQKPVAGNDPDLIAIGKKLLQGPQSVVDSLDIFADGFENDERKTRLVKVYQAYHIFRELIAFYTVTQLKNAIEPSRNGSALSKNASSPSKSVSAVPATAPAPHAYLRKSFDKFREELPTRVSRTGWRNIGGQLITETSLKKLILGIHSGRIRSWASVHQFYSTQGAQYPADKLAHALAAFRQVYGIDLKKATQPVFSDLFRKSIRTREWLVKNIYESREKDYRNPFRRMPYSVPEEMETVLGALKDNNFIKQEREACRTYTLEVEEILAMWNTARTK
ncbi:MAG: DUF4954 family protein [Puia sp.]|nr:DUF4954 family protein [Puia sp.]